MERSERDSERRSSQPRGRAVLLLKTHSSAAVLVAVLLLSPFLARAQHPQAPTSPPEDLAVSLDSLEGRFAIYGGATGRPVSLPQMIDSLQRTEVVFLGEEHDDPAAHKLERLILQRAYRQYHDRRLIALSLEMFERDEQPVVDEYLAGLITERHFLGSARAWSNYETGYRPLVEFAREHDLPVIAANAPRRYVNRVARLGRSSLRALPESARRWLPPLPYPQASAAYERRWKDQMQGAEPTGEQEGSDSTQAHPHGGGESHLLDAQVLWDAAMAYSIAQFLTARPEALVFHVTGAFHVEEGLGTPEMLTYYRPGAELLTIVMRPADDITSFDEEERQGLADFVILTDEAYSLPSSSSTTSGH